MVFGKYISKLCEIVIKICTVGSGYNIVTSAKNGLFGLNFGEEAYTLIMDYANTKLRDYVLKDISFIDGEHFVAMYHTHLIVFSKDVP